MTDYTLRCGDCVDYMATMADNSVDLIAIPSTVCRELSHDSLRKGLLGYRLDYPQGFHNV